MKKLKAIFVIIILSPVIAYNQRPDDFYDFKRITKEDGLGHNNVECIYQDSDGLIWFGTRNGLSRFDGYEIKTFRAEKTKNSLSGNWILSICEDHEGNLWVGTLLNGVNRFNKQTGIFKQYIGNQYGFGNRVNDILVLKNGSLWLSTENGLAMYQPEYDNFKVYYPENSNDHSINSYQVFDMIQARNGKCYVATWNTDIQLFIPDSGYFENISYRRSPELTIDYRKKLCEDRDGNIWITANQHGLVRYNPETGESVLYTAKNDGLGSNLINGCLAVGATNDIWIATDGDGINILHTGDGSFSYLKSEMKNDCNLPGNQVYTVYSDNQNIIWTGFYGKGVAYYNPQASKFKRTLFKKSDLNILEGKSVISIFEDSRKRVWIGTDGEGLYLFEEGRNPKIFLHDPDTESISSNVITSIGEDPSGNILAGTYAAGFNRIDPNTGKIKVFSQMENGTSVNSSSIWDIHTDSRGRVWLGLLGNGLDLFDYKSEEFTNMGPGSVQPDRVNHPNTMVIMEDSDGDVWFGTEGNGAFILDYQSGRLTRMSLSEPDSVLLSSVIRSFYQDRKGMIWIGTEGEGLYIYNKKNGNIRNISIEEGLPDQIIQGVLEDDRGNYWISTGNGMALYTPVNERIVNFSTSDGLSANEFNADAFIQLSDGRMIAGTSEGIDILSPSEIVLNQNIPRVILTRLLIMNNEINAGDTLNNRIVLDKEISYTKELVLTPRDKIVSIEFAALNYSLPEKCEYEYMLEGLDPDWVRTSSARRLASYSNLKQGDYVFRVRASNNDGKWGNNTIELKITVLPPFWNTGWFIGIIVFSFLTITFFIYRARLNYYKNAFLRKQTMQEKRIVELEKENLENELKKLTFFRLSRNRVLLELKMRLEGLSLKAKESVKTGLDKVIIEIDQQISSDIDWKYLEPQVDKTYNDFLTKLREKHSDLSVAELRIAAYVRMDLTTKEMSEFMHKTIRAVENDRYRLRKKLKLESNDSLQNYLMNL